MKHYLLCIVLFFSTLLYSYTNTSLTACSKDCIQNSTDRELSQEEVKKRGIDLLATELMENIPEIDLKSMARSSIFETSYGFRWKMFNLKNGNMIIIKVNKDFKPISIRNSSRS